MEDKLRAVFKSVFHRDFSEGTISKDEVEEWDSLRHIKLIIELESEFNVDIEPDDIPLLYSDFSTILEFLNKKTT